MPDVHRKSKVKQQEIYRVQGGARRHPDALEAYWADPHVSKVVNVRLNQPHPRIAECAPPPAMYQPVLSVLIYDVYAGLLYSGIHIECKV